MKVKRYHRVVCGWNLKRPDQPREVRATRVILYREMDSLMRKLWTGSKKQYLAGTLEVG
jgi:hypothetical protein